MKTKTMNESNSTCVVLISVVKNQDEVTDKNVYRGGGVA